MFERFGLPEILVVLVIVLILFGPSRITGIFRSLGSGIHEFKKGMREGDAPSEPTQKPPSQPPKDNPL